ncbi:hypothetical protein AVEN_61566-1 [Araneus ventricosus]|uniref:Uncharacterized protein n=1 Tax=Araneus ventricosus TaxID=182803 RepID=A0A4Y2N4X6_ARAVE|nr:hypothetical protein AVEN_61566-1 [Araneus ventricosus]
MLRHLISQYPLPDSENSFCLVVRMPDSGAKGPRILKKDFGLLEFGYLASRFETTRELLWDGPPNYELRSGDKDDT